MMTRFVWIIWIGGAILGYVAAEMILTDRSLAGWLAQIGPSLRLLPIVPAVAIAVAGWWFARNGRKEMPERA